MTEKATASGSIAATAAPGLGAGGAISGEKSPFIETGSSGLKQFSGYIFEEFLPRLQGRQAALTYREMEDNDPTIGAMLFAIRQVVQAVEWRVEPADPSPEAKKEAKFVESLMKDMDHTWAEFLGEALTLLPYGYAPMEIVLKKRTSADSAYFEMPADDGRVGIKKLALRGQDTILKWVFDESLDPIGITQQPWSGGMIDIPMEKILLFRMDARKNNPEGRSILRNAYRPWYFLKRIQEIEAIGVERDLAGLPMMYVPNAMLVQAAAGDAGALAALNEYKTILTSTRRGAQEGVLIPSDTWEGSSTRMYEFALLSSGGRRNFDTVAIKAAYQQDIAASTLADFILMGRGAYGTQSLGVSKVDMFMQAVEALLKSIAATLNRKLMPMIWKLNALDRKLMPKIEPDMAERPDLGELGAYIGALASAGMPLFPDKALEEYVRDAGGLPAAVEGENTRMPVQQLGHNGGPPLDDEGKPQEGNPGAGAPPGKKVDQQAEDEADDEEDEAKAAKAKAEEKPQPKPRPKPQGRWRR